LDTVSPPLFDPPLSAGDAVLFDMDGTLLMLPVAIDEVRDRLGDYHRRYGLDMTFRPLTDDLARAARRLHEMLPPAEARAAVRWARNTVEQAEVDAAPAAEARVGVVEALAELQLRGVAVGVVSNNTDRGVRAGLAAVGIDPAGLLTVVTRDDVPQPKPSPVGIELAARQLLRGGWQPTDGSRFVYVGDAPSDLFACQALDIGRFVPRLPRPSVIIVGGGRAGSGSLVGPDADAVAADDLEARDLLLGS
jgi:beta-phosphoglucomutase-like phosphatase (HAD superfamily)